MHLGGLNRAFSADAWGLLQFLGRRPRLEIEYCAFGAKHKVAMWRRVIGIGLAVSAYYLWKFYGQTVMHVGGE